MPYSSLGADVEANALRREAEWAQKRAAKAARKAANAAARAERRAQKQAEQDRRDQEKVQKLADRAAREAAKAEEQAEKLRQREQKKAAKEERAEAARERKREARQRAQAAQRAQPAQLALPLQPRFEPLMPFAPLEPLEPLQAVLPGVAGFAAPPPTTPVSDQGWADLAAVREEQLREEQLREEQLREEAAAARRRERASAAFAAKNAAGVDAARAFEQAAVARKVQSEQAVELARVAREEAEARAKAHAQRPLAIAPLVHVSPDVPALPLPQAPPPSFVAVGVAVGAPVVPAPPAPPAPPVVLGETPCSVECLKRAADKWVARLYEPGQMAPWCPATIGDVCVFHEASLEELRQGCPQAWLDNWGNDYATRRGYWSPLANAAPHVLLQAMSAGKGADTPLATVGTELTAEPSLRPRIAQDGDARYTTGPDLNRPLAPFVAQNIWWNMQRATESFEEQQVALVKNGLRFPGEFLLCSLHAPMEPGRREFYRGRVQSFFYNEDKKIGVNLYGERKGIAMSHDITAPCSQTLFLWHRGGGRRAQVIGAITFRVIVTCDDAVVFLVELLGTLESFKKCGVSGHLRRAMRAFAPPGHTGPHRVLTCANNFLWWRLARMSQRDDIRKPQPNACKLFMNVSLLDPLFMIDDPALLFQAKERALVDCGGAATEDDARVATGSYQLLFNLPPLE